MKIAKKTAALFKDNIHQKYAFGTLNKIDSKSALLSLHKGEVSNESIWLLKDDDGNEFAMIPQQILSNLTQTIRHLQDDKFFMNLEREIAAQMPIDMEDAISVALQHIESLRKTDGTLPLLNPAKIARNLRKQYPNLFFNFEEFLAKNIKQ